MMEQGESQASFSSFSSPVDRDHKNNLQTLRQSDVSRWWRRMDDAWDSRRERINLTWFKWQIRSCSRITRISLMSQTRRATLGDIKRTVHWLQSTLITIRFALHFTLAPSTINSTSNLNKYLHNTLEFMIHTNTQLWAGVISSFPLAVVDRMWRDGVRVISLPLMKLGIYVRHSDADMRIVRASIIVVEKSRCPLVWDAAGVNRYLIE